MVLNWVKKSEHGIPKQKQLISIEIPDTNNESPTQIDQFKVFQEDYLMLIN